ncbi:unnamed protein product [Amoebophrya sp. A120]|nr:unnamed protein product [Amoebophrya sp. A120]|eukprot:GSA120T00003205001.1
MVAVHKERARGGKHALKDAAVDMVGNWLRNQAKTDAPKAEAPEYSPEGLKTQTVQRLWEGYGAIVRVSLPPAITAFLHTGGALENVSTVVLKCIQPPVLGNSTSDVLNPPSLSHQRKLKSYQVEANFYEHFLPKLDLRRVRVPRLLHRDCSTSDSTSLGFILEDLDAAGFPERKHSLSARTVRPVLTWLARFHKTFLYCDTDQRSTGSRTNSNVVSSNSVAQALIWPEGCYWHLDTRPDEFQRISPKDSPLRRYAGSFDEKLKAAKWKTVVHGDAKIENFCFPPTNGAAPAETDVAAVDFQYTGFGVGVRDVAYCLGGWGLSESEMEKSAEELLDFYFAELKTYQPRTMTVLRETCEENGGEVAGDSRAKKDTIDHHDQDFLAEVEAEWRELWPVCFADFERFLAGWASGHDWKRSGRYTVRMVEKAIQMVQGNSLNANSCSS